MIYQWVCDDHPATASPEAYVYGQFHYLLDVLSGFPVDKTSKKTRPEFRQTYKWINKDLVTVGRDNCLYANSWSPPLPPPLYIYRKDWDKASAYEIYN